jgi:putative hydrolase of the HAD superfamily
MTPVRAVLFDFDGTLGTYRSHLALYVAAAAEHGVEVTEESLRATLDDSWRQWMTPAGVDHAAYSASEEAYNAGVRSRLHVARLAGAGGAGNLEAAARRLCELESDPAEYLIYEDTLPALQRLKAAGLRIGIVSNHVWRLPEVIDALGLGRYVDCVLTSARVGYRKPHPQIYRAAIEAMVCSPGAVLFVGDSVSHDIEGPRAAGMQAVLIDRAGTYQRDGVIRTLADLVLP